MAIKSIQAYESDEIVEPSFAGLPQVLKCNYTVDELGRENILNWLEDTASGVDASLPTNYALQFVESGCWEEITSDEQGMRIFEAWLEADEEIHKYRLQQKLQGAEPNGNSRHESFRKRDLQRAFIRGGFRLY